MIERIISIPFILCLLMTLSYKAAGQTKIAGQVTYLGQGVSDVRVFIDGTYDEALTKPDGSFVIETQEKGSQLLIAHHKEYVNAVSTIMLGQKAVVEVELRFLQKEYQLKSVVFTARKEREISKEQLNKLSLTPMEVNTTATDGNVLTAIKAMPGTQQVGESGKLFVRGGSGAETRVFLDGILINNYESASAPNQAGSMRIPANLLESSSFSAGGYSARYGQALSSVVMLESKDIPYSSAANIAASPLFLALDAERVSQNKQWSVGGSVKYQDFSLYADLLKPQTQNQDFEQAPRAFEGGLTLKRRTSEKGIIKNYLTASYSTMLFKKEAFDQPGLNLSYGIQNFFLLDLLNWKERYKGWDLNTSFAVNINRENVLIDSLQTGESSREHLVKEDYKSLQFRSVGSKRLNNRLVLDVGMENQVMETTVSFDELQRGLFDNYLSVFSEAHLNLAYKLNMSMGLRYEYSSFLKKSKLAPRLTLNYDLNPISQFYTSWGQFYQRPGREYLNVNPDLGFQKATHYIAGFLKHSKSIFIQSEVFYKQYDELIKTTGQVDNSGEGYAMGAEVFLKDKQTFESFEYWLSYSYLDSKRNYLNYPYAVQPSFAANHVFSVVLKKYISGISTHVSSSYSFASGRPYFNPNQEANAFMQDRTPAYHNMGLTLAHLTKIAKSPSVLVLTVNNLIGNKQVFGYEYSSRYPEKRQEIVPMYNRFIFLGLFINIGIDRRDEIIDELIN